MIWPISKLIIGQNQYPSQGEGSILGASLHQKAGNVGEKAPKEEESQESSFGVGSSGGKSKQATEQAAERGEKHGNEGRNLLCQPFSHMTSPGDHYIYYDTFGDCFDFMCSQ